MHRMKFNEFEILTRLKTGDNIKNIFNVKIINIQHDFKMGKPFWVIIAFTTELDKIDDMFENGVNYEVEIIFVSHLKNITYNHYREQPKSMLVRKLLRRYKENGINKNFENNWVPDLFLMKFGECDEVEVCHGFN